MKYVTITILSCTLLLSCVSGGTPKTEAKEESAQTDTVSMNAAIGDFAAYIAKLLPGNSVTAVAVTDSPVQRLGNYIADELTGKLFNSGVRMVSRQDFERLVSEQNLQLDPRFNDKTTVSITQNLGWKTIIFGAVEPLQVTYRLSLRAVNVETGELQGSKSYMLNGRDPVLISMVNPNISAQRLTERETLLQPFNGKRNNFNLTVSTNKTVYYDGDELLITLRSNEDCYFVVYQVDVANNMQVIFPNPWDKNNFLKAGVSRTIPENSAFSLHQPYGEEWILAYASPRDFKIPEDQYRPVPVTQDLLASPQALWRVESGGGSSKGVSITPRGATGQANYSVLPGR
jgi:hypothetical protein